METENIKQHETGSKFIEVKEKSVEKVIEEIKKVKKVRTVKIKKSVLP